MEEVEKKTSYNNTFCCEVNSTRLRLAFALEFNAKFVGKLKNELVEIISNYS